MQSWSEIPSAWDGALLVAACAVAAAGLLVVLARLLKLVRRTPAEKERRRRQMVNRRGRIVAGEITDAEGDTIYFRYKIRGVEYLASQDVSALRERLPENLGLLVGAASVKYLTENPANSIAICEEWSGMRVGGNSGASRRSLPDAASSRR